MALFIDDEEAWRCRKHPSKRPTTGACPSASETASSLSAPNALTSDPTLATPLPPLRLRLPLPSSLVPPPSLTPGSGPPAACRISLTVNALSDARDPLLCLFFRRHMDKKDDETGNPPLRHGSKTSLWSVIKAKRGKKTKKPEEVEEVQYEVEAKKKMTRSKSVSFPSCSRSGGNEKLKAKSWHFSEPNESVEDAQCCARRVAIE